MIDLLQNAAMAGGKVLLKYFRQDFATSYKTSHQNIVTEADLESQKAIYKTIMAQMSKRGFKKQEIGFIGEEGLNIAGKHKFIVDPLDGTTNFSVGLKLFCIPIAYMVDEKIVASIVYIPHENIFFSAEVGMGSYIISGKKKQPLKMKYVPLDQTAISAHLSSNPAVREKQIGFFSRLFPKARGMRNLGSIALEHCLTADNVLGAVINNKSYVWDLAATKLILEEAGGILTELNGKKIILDLKDPNTSYETIACHPKNLQVILDAALTKK